MPTILFMQGWRVFFYSDEGNEPMHVHAKKGDAECKLWLLPESYELEEEWSYNLTPRLRREIRKIAFDHFELIVGRMEQTLSRPRMRQVTEVITAKSIQPTAEALIVNLADRTVRVPWEHCSLRLAKASTAERLAAELSPGGYGIHWPLLDEDISVGGLLRECFEAAKS